jgi:hypothetical protein
MDIQPRVRSNQALRALPKSGRRNARQSRAAISDQAALRVLLSKTVEFLVSAYESPEHVALELEEQAARVKARLPLGRLRDERLVHETYERLVEVCGVVHDWHREPAHTNKTGEPLELTQRSLTALVSKRFPKHKVPATVQWMFDKGVIRRTSRGKIALRGGRAVIFWKEGRPADLLLRTCAVVPQYLRTALRNATIQDRFLRNVDRDARVSYLPEKYVPLWREVVRERARVFLESVDNWLEDHARRDDAGPVREVAMHCYSYTGDSRLPKAARARSHQLRARRR